MSDHQLNSSAQVQDQSLAKNECNRHKREIIRQLHAIAVLHLFGDCNWLCDRETCGPLHRLGLEMKLWEPVQDSKYTRPTALGQELNVRLLGVFMGEWDPWEVPDLLLEGGLINEAQAEKLYGQLEHGLAPEKVLKRIVQIAYRAYCNSAKWLH